MSDATAPVRHWQQLLAPLGFVLTHPGYVRFTQWVTGTALGWEEHTLTQVLTSMGHDGRWHRARGAGVRRAARGHRGRPARGRWGRCCVGADPRAAR